MAINDSDGSIEIEEGKTHCSLGRRRKRRRRGNGGWW